MKIGIIVTTAVIGIVVMLLLFLAAVDHEMDKVSNRIRVEGLGIAVSAYAEINNGKFPSCWDDLFDSGVLRRVEGEPKAAMVPQMQARHGGKSETYISNIQLYDLAFGVEANDIAGVDANNLQSFRPIYDQEGNELLLIKLAKEEPSAACTFASYYVAEAMKYYSAGHGVRWPGYTLEGDMLRWYDKEHNVVCAVVEREEMGYIMTYLWAISPQRNRRVLLDGAARLLVRHGEWLLVVDQEKVRGGYNYDTQRLYGEYESNNLPMKVWNGEGRVVAGEK